jgi:hypothetical protein
MTVDSELECVDGERWRKATHRRYPLDPKIDDVRCSFVDPTAKKK